MLEERARIRRLLWRWGRVMEYCAARQREIEGFKDIARAARDLPPIRITGLPGSKQPGDPTARMAARANELAERYDGTINKLIADCDRELAFMRAMDDLINRLPGEQQRILDLRYKQGWNWDYIALKTCFSVQHTKYLEAAAVDEIGTGIEVKTF